MENKKLTVLAVFTGKIGMGDKIENELKALIGPTRKETGCIEYRLHRSKDNPDNFMFYETWISKGDLDKHLKTEHLTTIGARANTLCASSPTVTFWEEYA